MNGNCLHVISASLGDATALFFSDSRLLEIAITFTAKQTTIENNSLSRVGLFYAIFFGELLFVAISLEE